MKAAGAAHACAGTERFVDDDLEGVGAATAVGAATKTAVELLGISGQGSFGAYGIADVMVAEQQEQTII